MNAAIEPARLYTVLTRTGLQTKDPVLYQLLYNLIGNLVKLRADDAANAGGGGGSSSSTVNNLTQYIIQSLGQTVRTTEYMMIGQSGSSTPVTPTYDSVLTNGDPLTPEIIFDSFGDVIMVTGLPL